MVGFIRTVLQKMIFIQASRYIHKQRKFFVIKIAFTKRKYQGALEITCYASHHYKKL